MISRKHKHLCYEIPNLNRNYRKTTRGGRERTPLNMTRILIGIVLSVIIAAFGKFRFM